MLEPDEGKLSSPVLRGLAPSNGGWLLGLIIRGTHPWTAKDQGSERLVRDSEVIQLGNLTVTASAFVGTSPDELEKNRIRAEVCEEKECGLASRLRVYGPQRSVLVKRCSGRLLAIVPETFRAFTSFLK
jgi:hypothetical protein